MAARPPRIQTGDESSDDHFSSASEGTSVPASPIPITRVERVDDQPSHGEVPGTLAYDMRTTDAVPDEIEVIPDGQRSRSGTRSRASSHLSPTGDSRPRTPDSGAIPRTVVERVDDKPAHGEVDGTLAKEMRMADAEPDEIRQASDVARTNLEGSSESQEVNDAGRQQWFRSMWEGDRQPSDVVDDDEQKVGDDFGDDFDDFNEGGGDDDFGDFDEAADEGEEHIPPPAIQPPLPEALNGLPPIDFSACNTPEDLQHAIAPYIQAILPDSQPVLTMSRRAPFDTSGSSPFLSDRSLSLWQQLVSPPPMQPPNWTRSKIRRLFLVSLGVPVDLDEILPPSKQKRLVLPNVNFERTSPRPSSAIERLKAQGANDSSTSVDSKGQAKPAKSRRVPVKGPPLPPDLDTNAATLLCRTTEEALSVYTDAELKDHVLTLQGLNDKASKTLEYWLHRKDDGMREKEALEGVIENLVGFVKGRRGK